MNSIAHASQVCTIHLEVLLGNLLRDICNMYGLEVSVWHVG